MDLIANIVSRTVKKITYKIVKKDIEWTQGILRYPELEERLKSCEEVFVPVVGYENNYVVSNYCKIQRKLKNNKLSQPMKLNPDTDECGYVRVKLTKDSISKSFNASKIVLDSFYKNPNPEHFTTRDHQDTNRANNYLSNLIFATMRYQNQSFNKKPNPKSAADKNSRPIRMLDLKGNYVMTHKSLASASEWLRKNGYPSANTGHISNCAKEKHKYIYGHKWEYVEVENLPGEVWEPVPIQVLNSSDGPYMASTMGRIINKHGKPIEGSSHDKEGYIILRETRAHIVIGKTFVPNDDPVNKIHLNHKNKKRNDNRSCNLEWSTVADNIQHAIDNGPTNIVRVVKATDLETKSSVTYPKNKDAAKALGVSPTTIKNYHLSKKPLKVNGKQYKIEYMNV